MSEIRNLTRNGETFYPLTCSDAVLNRDGEPLGIVNDIFDISEYNATGTPPVLATYASLDLALAAVPSGKQKGGMTIRYVQTSDNKYVQYRLMADSWSIDTNDWAIADEGVYVENSEFVSVKLDAEGRILWAIRTNGSIYYGAGVPPQVINYIQQKIEELSLEDIVAFMNGLEEGDKTLAELLSEKIDKEEDRSLIDKDVADGIHYDENSKFIDVETDDENRVLGGRKSNGKKFENVGIETPEITINTVDVEVVDDLQKRMNVTLDGDGRIVSHRDKNGVLHENTGIKTPKLSIGIADINTSDDYQKRMNVGLDDENRILYYRDKNGMLHENVGIGTERIKISPTGLDELKDDLNIHIQHSSPKFIQISDSHYDNRRPSYVENGVNNEQREQLLVDFINENIRNEGNIDFIIDTGDLSGAGYVNGEGYDNMTPFKTAVIDNITPKTLFLPVVGNHDAYTEQEWYNAWGFPRQYSVEFSSCFVIVLDVYKNSNFWCYYPSAQEADSQGYVTEEYVAEHHITGGRSLRFTAIDNVFLEENLKKAKAIGKEIIVALHTTNPDSATDEDMSAAEASVTAFNSLLNKYGCRLLLYGHSHIIRNVKVGNIWRCNPGWWGEINSYNYNTSQWAINVFKQNAGYFKVYNNVIAHNYIDTPRLGDVPASSTPTNLWEDNVGRAEYKFI